MEAGSDSGDVTCQVTKGQSVPLRSAVVLPRAQRAAARVAIYVATCQRFSRAKVMKQSNEMGTRRKC